MCLNEDKTGQEVEGEKEMLIQAEHRVEMEKSFGVTSTYKKIQMSNYQSYTDRFQPE